ncbi:hypothetical protein GCM10027176_58810 [Actinoallomurus bryophytorum]|uniref:Uncharacterized protein n=1 Tax=Actinoallomurus bryophytorum TaxID=1490222 RepID=A0A543CHD0_9ACTN|nr:hypothetical protein [Actinoallomurus bryophytorum]TQL96420.1 hypothetical protein FB559_1948 [Actinoallomurus bryophytorum]
MAAGQYGSFDPSSYHFSDQDLQQIITKTANAVTEMNTVNSTVQAHTDSLVDANRSDSGQILSTHLTTWTTDFNTCVNNLNDLNSKATALLQVNRSTGLDTTSQAR